MRNDQLMRQWRLLRRLEASPRGVALRRLATDEDVHPRTLKRDLQALVEVGVPALEVRVGGERWWRLTENYARLVTFPISTCELIALALASPQLKPLELSDVAKAMDALMERVEATLTPEARALLTRLRSAVASGVPRANYGQLPGQLLRSAADRRTVEIVYRSAWRGATTSRKLDPYSIRLHAGTLYVVGRDHNRQAVRLFAVERIQKLKVTEVRFDDPCFDADEYFSRALDVMHEGRPYVVRIWVAADAAFFVEERPWHPSQKVHRQPDGSLEVQLRIDGLREMVWKVLSYGARVRALAPPELVSMVREELTASLAPYGSKSPG